jgi:hypothetical protein
LSAGVVRQRLNKTFATQRSQPMQRPLGGVATAAEGS